MMLVDKGYYDYDYSDEAKDKAKMRKKHKRTETEQKAIWERMGFGRMRTPLDSKPISKLSPDEAQRIAMEELKPKESND